MDLVVCIGIEGRIQRAVRIEAGDPVPCLPADGGKRTAREDLAVSLKGDGVDTAVCTGIEGRIRVPSALRRAIRFLVCPPIEVNKPPTRILPSDWRVMDWTQCCMHWD